MSSETLNVEAEAKGIALFYRTILDELHDTRVAEVLTQAYIQSFERRIGNG